MLNFTRRLGSLALAALLLAGCSALLPKLEPPQLSVVSVELIKADLLQQQLRVRMKVVNPNDRALPVRGITYTVEVGGEELAHGDSDRDFTVPALGDLEFDVNVHANAAPVLLKYALGGRRDAVDYRIAGKVQLAAGLVRSIPFSQTGRLNLR
jgi:LEA14-like dessication related protein